MELPAKLDAYLKNHFVVTPRVAANMGINRMHLQHYVKKENLKKIIRGVYAQNDAFLLDPILSYPIFLI